MKKINSIRDLDNALAKDETLQDRFKQDPVKTIKEISENRSPVPDNWIYRIVVGSLGLSVILVIIGTIILNPDSDKNLPTVFTAIASGAIGALAGLLAPSPVT